MLETLVNLGERMERESRDRSAAEGCLPADTRRISVAGTSGWFYPVVNEQGDPFRMFLWFDGSAYQVKVVEPTLGYADPHLCHLFPDARLCLGAEEGGGMPTLESAYARSVLWATGYGAFLRTGRFPF
ncbi:MAG TPA: hypothetical protein VLT47_04670 [Anaeromyxobacteraceae bacterium]|nr:hypothetical protein [Anaeromyxobacteraceae bacterium]